jgi:hypothetical protein
MKKRVIFLAMLALMGLSQSANAQGSIFVVNAAGSRVFESVHIAVQEAAAGDVIYLPAGEIEIEGVLVIDKKLSIIGAGWEDDSANGLIPTFFTNVKDNKGDVLIFKSGSDGSLLYGCFLHSICFGEEGDDPATQNIQNVTIARNRLGNIFLGFDALQNRNKNINIVENVSRGLSGIIGYNAEECIISNNLFLGGLSGLRRSVIAHNVLGGISTSPFCEVKNNYFINNPVDTEYCVYNNNAFQYNGTIPGANNLMNQSIGSTFQTQTYELIYPKDCVLKNDSPCKTGATDGTEIGMYGGGMPYKTGGAPFNLHVDRIKVSANTKEGLEVEAKVSVQER